MSAPRVSIGMPVFNGEKYLAEALDSLLAQSFTDFELIISDNASDDGTEAICRRFAESDRRVRYIRNDVNRGAAWNHNKVMGEARGELFKLACHDDVCDRELLAACVDALDARSDAVLANPVTLQMMNGDMSRLEIYSSDMALTSPVTAIRFGDLINEAPPSFPLFGVVRMNALRRIPWYESYKASDRVVLVRIALTGAFVDAPDARFYYRWHENNATHLVRQPAQFYRWWHPGRGGGRIYPETRLLYEYLRSLWKVPLSTHERRQCLREVRAWYAAKRPQIRAELGQLLGRPAPAAPVPSYFENLARRARRRAIKARLYPD